MALRSISLRRLSLASVSSLAMGAAAKAEPVYNWTGLYLGFNAGYAAGRSQTATTADCSRTLIVGGNANTLCEPGYPGEAPGVNQAGTGVLRGSGFTGGIQAGYN